MSRHTEQLASTIQRDLQNLLVRGLQDPRVKGLITVTGVRVTDDLTAAIVTVSVLPAEQQDLTMHGLRAAAGFLRRELGKTVQTRRLPALQFQLDESIKRGAEVLAAIDRVRAERLAKEAAGAGETTEDAES
jgi:ribosome-binding factor A